MKKWNNMKKTGMYVMRAQTDGLNEEECVKTEDMKWGEWHVDHDMV